MENYSDFVNYWTTVGQKIASGEGVLSISDLLAIHTNLQLDTISPDFLPGKNTIMGSSAKRKKAIFDLAEKLWGLSPKAWLTLERFKLRDARMISGSKEVSGKDKEGDVIMAEILVRIIATAVIVFEYKASSSVTHEALRALNLTIAEACSKGGARMEMINGRSVYSILKEGGLSIGSGGGNYLPNPEESLPFLLLFLRKEALTEEVYLK